MRTLLIVGLLLSTGCAGFFRVDTTSPLAVARHECENWLGWHNLMQRPRRGTTEWYELVNICTRKHLASAGAEIDRALAALPE